jgi:hypothetical protein
MTQTQIFWIHKLRDIPAEFPEEVESWSWILIEDESDHALIPDDMIDEGIRLGFIENMDGE